ncbi:hypothetical protein KO505_11025 [Psychrosphaera sp. F3M07]|uniref:hypothetical protein n=1 Tax=Psychrosphaera sp. F3M07 TaxID=2841560 RepID=UPI001C0936D5|nr:hypothetical protein [Psychrosphaera sp. F3M07]MBU2918488.1 hypothetical protein [Psychrosphaera sp. F3M07]
MKLTETHTHYLGLFGGFAIMFIVIFAGWELAETFDWFAEVWESMGNRLFIIFSGTMGIIWLIAFIYSYFWGKRKFIRTFIEVERKSLNDCVDGQVVRIQGVLKSIGEPLVAPFSRKQCSTYETRALRQEDVVTTKGHGTHVEQKTIWETIKVVSDSKDFLIRCGEQYALIRVDDCQMKIHEDIAHDEPDYERDRGGFLTEAENNKRKEALEQMGLQPRSYIGVYAANIKFEEGILEPDEQVAVKGQGKWIATAELPDLSEIAQQGIEKVFEIKAGDNSPLVISDSLDVLES